MTGSVSSGPASRRFVLFIGNELPRSSSSRLKASGVRYVQKRLQSGPPNWQSIRSLVAEDGLICVVAKLNTAVFNRIASADYASVASDLLEALTRVPHALFVHESVLTGEPTGQTGSEAADDDEDPDGYFAFHYSDFSSPDAEVRATVARAFYTHQLRVVPYTTNAEFEVMADQFVAENERDLLFRVYVPAGRLYAAEADKLLGLFRDWLARLGRQGVRQDGYETPSGHMYEFFGDGQPRSQDLSADFEDFAAFLDLCVTDADEAERRLRAHGLDEIASSALVARYGKESLRLQLDLKHERERRIVEIRHRLENELLEGSLDDREDSAVRELVERLVPSPTAGLGRIVSGELARTTKAVVNVQVNQQFIETVQDSVVQNVNGTANLGPEAQALLDLIREHGNERLLELETAVHELEDGNAPDATRLKARQLLKGFLIKVSTVAEEAGTKLLTKYLEGKLGL